MKESAPRAAGSGAAHDAAAPGPATPASPAPPAPYPGYDVLRKRDGPSWDAVTNAVIADRLAVHPAPRYFTPREWPMVRALCGHIVPQDTGADVSLSTRVPLPELLDDKLLRNPSDGFRGPGMPRPAHAWRIGLAALDAESIARHDTSYAALRDELQLELLRRMESGKLSDPAWSGMPPDSFFRQRVLHDICGLYYAHPHAWSRIGFGGPANPRGYVRMYFDRRDPWEPREARADGSDEPQTRRENQRVR